MPYRRKDSPVWWATYTDASGKRVRRSTGTENRKEAEALEAKWKLEAFRQQHWDELPERLFDELMLGYLKETRERKRSHVRDLCSMRHLLTHFREHRLSEISAVAVRTYIQKRRDEGAAASTVNKEVGLLSSAIGHARREWGWSLANPVQGNREREPAGRVRWITREEAERLTQESSLDPRAQHLPDFIALALNTGMRKGEILGLEWNRVDFSRNLLFLEPEHTKTARRRSVPLNDAARGAIVNRARFRAEHCPDGRWVFAHKDGTRIKDVKTAFRKACRRAGIENFRIHDLRHTCAAWLVQANVRLDRVRDLLGHRSIETTEIYAHLAPDDIREAVDALKCHDLVTPATRRGRQGSVST